MCVIMVLSAHKKLWLATSILVSFQLTEILGTWEDTHVNFIHDITANTKSASVWVKAPKVFFKRKKRRDFCFLFYWEKWDTLYFKDLQLWLINNPWKIHTFSPMSQYCFHSIKQIWKVCKMPSVQLWIILGSWLSRFWIPQNKRKNWLIQQLILGYI